MFDDRTDAGRQLADLLDVEDVEADVVLAIPRGALPVARPVAERLDVPLDVVVAAKIGAPDNEELAIGAVASDGTVWLNDDLVDRLGIPGDYVEREREREAANAREKANRYRGDRDPPALDAKDVLIVDDGIATGATARVSILAVEAAGADRVILAAPVGSPDEIERLRTLGDEVVVVESPPHFRAVGQFYEQFDQVSDEEAMSYLDGE